jgi:hypothetical protein
VQRRDSTAQRPARPGLMPLCALQHSQHTWAATLQTNNGLSHLELPVQQVHNMRNHSPILCLSATSHSLPCCPNTHLSFLHSVTHHTLNCCPSWCQNMWHHQNFRPLLRSVAPCFSAKQHLLQDVTFMSRFSVMSTVTVACAALLSTPSHAGLIGLLKLLACCDCCCPWLPASA